MGHMPDGKLIDMKVHAKPHVLVMLIAAKDKFATQMGNVSKNVQSLQVV